MKLRTQKITALMAAAVLGISALGSVPVTAAESTETADIGEAMAVDGEAVSSDLVAGTFKPSDVTCKAQDSYEYPFLGLKLSLSKELLKQIKDQSIAMLTTEDFENQTNAVTYAYVSWSKMTPKYRRWEQDMTTGWQVWTELAQLEFMTKLHRKSWMRSLAVQSIKSLEAAVTGNTNII